MAFIWKTLILFFGSIILLRVSGRKSISQMTIGTTVVMISIGAVIVQPLVDKGVVKTLTTISLFIGTLLVLEFLQMKFKFIENLLLGKAIVIVENGQLNMKNLRRLRLTEEKLNMRLRQHGISRLSDVLTVTIEATGEIGFELKPDAKPMTVSDFKRLLGLLSEDAVQPQTEQTLFSESLVKAADSVGPVLH